MDEAQMVEAEAGKTIILFGCICVWGQAACPKLDGNAGGDPRIHVLAKLPSGW